MNTLFIVLPILTLLMFDLGLTLEVKDFLLFKQRPRPVLVGLFGQIILLPAIAFGLAFLFHLPTPFFIGVVLIACCPGGSSSNIFSMLAKGDVALSVALTAISSIVTLFTIPFILGLTTSIANQGESTLIQLPIGNLLIQNLLLMLLPIMAGVSMKRRYPNAASRTERILSKIAFPALILLAGVFFIQHHETISNHMGKLGLCITLLILLAINGGALIARLFHLQGKEVRTIVIEVGMQNAAQAIAIASSPFIFNDGIIAIPAIIYALMMNVILLCYVGWIKRIGLQ